LLGSADRSLVPQEIDQIVAAVGIVWNCQTYQFASVRVVAREFAAIRVKSTFWFRSLGPASGKGATGNICGRL